MISYDLLLITIQITSDKILNNLTTLEGYRDFFSQITSLTVHLVRDPISPP